MQVTMIFLFILHCLFLNDNVLARPLDLPPLHPTSEISLCPREIDPNKFTQRSEWNIVWSCFTTIFSCSWVAIHLNIPAPSDSSTKIFFRRLIIMVYMLIAPEYVIIWAGRQWYAAHDIANKHKDRGWTGRTHGFFVLMGGFMLYENSVMTEALSIERLEELESEGRIHWPSISEKEIEDRSKGDAFSKAFAVVQTTWFITQCMARGVYGLVITELEVATLAFAALNGILYFFWWNKPLGVACPVPVYLISSKREAGTQAMLSDYTETPDHTVPPILSGLSPATNLSPSSSDNEELSHPLPFIMEMESTPLEQTSSTSFQHFLAFVRRHRAVVRRHRLKLKHMMVFIFSEFFLGLGAMGTCTATDGNQALSVPTFYAPSYGKSKATITIRSIFIGSMMGSIFGGTHCIALSFPSVQEKYSWRTSAATITVIPLLLLSILFVLEKVTFEWVGRFVGYIVFLLSAITCEWINGSVGWVNRHIRVDRIAQFIESAIFFGYSVCKIILSLALMFCIVAYFFSRVALLTLPLIALRSLPPGSLVDIKWSSFIPHI